MNDLGFVSFGNDQCVLDYWGLASPLALVEKGNPDPEGMQQLAVEKQVSLAMIYRSPLWFRQVPAP